MYMNPIITTYSNFSLVFFEIVEGTGPLSLLSPKFLKS